MSRQTNIIICNHKLKSFDYDNKYLTDQNNEYFINQTLYMIVRFKFRCKYIFHCKILEMVFCAKNSNNIFIG